MKQVRSRIAGGPVGPWAVGLTMTLVMVLASAAGAVHPTRDWEQTHVDAG